MFEVMTYTERGQVIDTAEGCEGMEGARTAARTLWDDSVKGETGVATAVVYDGDKAVRTFTARPS